MEKLTGDYIQAKRIWGEMKFLSTYKNMNDEELEQLRNAYAIVKEHDEAQG